MTGVVALLLEGGGGEGECVFFSGRDKAAKGERWMNMGGRLLLSQYDIDISFYRSPARTALPAAHFDRNAYTVTDLVHLPLGSVIS